MSSLRNRFVSIINAAKVCLGKINSPQGRKHDLDADLIVSLTSYPPRFPFLYFTLKSILMQSVRPDSVVLWLAEKDRHNLPRSVEKLQKYGLEIRICDDLRSYKKIIPSAVEDGSRYILIADDDVYYPPDWISSLIKFLPSERPTIFCGRAHKVVTSHDGRPRRYCEWKLDVPPGPPSKDLFPTGVGGVIYPPHSLDEIALNKALFLQLCPTGDDIWLYWSSLRKGYEFQNVYDSNKIIPWPLSQKSGLHLANTMGENANDVQINAMIEHFGVPSVQ